MGERSTVKLYVPAIASVTTALFLAAWGCSSESTPAATPASETGGETATALTNACKNAKDQVGVFRSYCAPDPYEKDAATPTLTYKSFAEVSSDCAKFCVLDPVERDNPKCVINCLKTATKDAISDSCLSCREQMVACGRKYCIAECAPGPLDVKCLRCMCGDNYTMEHPEGYNCYNPYNACSGLDLKYCNQLDAGVFDGFPPPTDAGACD